MLGNTVKDGSGTSYWALMDSEGRLIVARPWTPDLQSDTAANDSDKSLTVPASTEWLVHSIWVELTSTGTAGNRQIVIEIQDDSADVIAQFRAGVVQAATNTYYYLFAPNVVDLTSVRDSDYISTPIPEMVLPAAYVIRVYDNNAVDAAADDMVVHARVSSRSV